MKAAILLFALGVSFFSINQTHAPLAHGTVYGKKPTTSAEVKASALEAFMDKKTRISTTISGRVIKVTKQKGGWFTIDAGNGKVIAAHFSVINVTIPNDLAGRDIIAEGIAEKQFIADDMQHLAGDTVTGKKQHNVKTNPKQKVTFEVKGLEVN
jgi:hypothetical protein